MHRKPLPLETYPLPVFHPSQPLSLLQLAYTYITQLISRPSSHTLGPYIGIFHPETRSVHINDPLHIRALWEMGFFGKGTLSRSEPSWLTREKARKLAQRKGGMSAEEVTLKRREERRIFKLERARVEREAIEAQRAREEKGQTFEDAVAGARETQPVAKLSPNQSLGGQSKHELVEGRVPDAEIVASKDPAPEQQKETAVPSLALQDDPPGFQEKIEEEEPIIEDEEHLQLTLEEAFFLSYGLGILHIRSPAQDGTTPPSALPAPSLTSPTTLPPHFSNAQLLELYRAHSHFPPLPLPSQQTTDQRPLSPDDPFFINYAVYHHFRALGWVIRPGVKFAVDFLLYNRGPVFSHAEFAVMIIPSYVDAFWETDEGMKLRRPETRSDWWWLHCVNRVQSAVRKSLVLVYVEVPAPVEDEGGEVDIGRFFKGFKIREFMIKRWLANRSRD